MVVATIWPNARGDRHQTCESLVVFAYFLLIHWLAAIVPVQVAAGHFRRVQPFDLANGCEARRPDLTVCS
jgi:hypothetical protein